MVPRAPRLVHLGRRRRAAEQLARRLRRLGLDARRASGRWYLHSFYPEQPDLDWRNPEVVAAMQDVLRFWLERGVGRLPHRRHRPAAEGPASCATTRRPRSRSGCRCARTRPSSRCIYSRNAPDTGDGARARSARRRATRSWSARSTCRARAGSPTSTTSTPCSRSSCSTRPGRRGALRAAIEATDAPARRAGLGALEPRLRPRWPRASARENARAAAMLLLTLPGPGVPLPGRRDRPGRGPGRRAALRPRRPRPPPPPDAVGRLAERRLHHRRALAAARRPGSSATSPTSATTRARCCRSCAS